MKIETTHKLTIGACEHELTDEELKNLQELISQKLTFVTLQYAKEQTNMPVSVTAYMISAPYYPR